MKRIITISMTAFLLAASTGRASEANFCAEAYDKKLERIQDRRVIRSIGEFGMLAGMGYVSLVTAIGVPAAIFGGSAGTLGLVGWIGGVAHVGNKYDDTNLNKYFYPALTLNREPGLEAAVALMEQTALSKEELKSKLYENYLRSGGSISYGQFVVQNTLMNLLLEKVNKKRDKKGKRLFTYDELRAEVSSLMTTDAFCPLRRIKKNGEEVRAPRTLRQIKKILDKLD